MTDPLHTLNALGWEWRENGVVICVTYDRNRTVSVFVPLQKVWEIFNRHMSGVGCPLMLGVGEPFTVGGLFSSIKHGLSSVAKGVSKASGLNAVASAASQVAQVAKNYGTAAVNQIAKVPLVGPLAKSTASLLTAPIGMADQLARGGRIDRVALQGLKTSLANAKQIAPYAQTVMSFVPGVGTGLSGALGASLALASGQSLNDAFLAGVKAAIPGGPLVQSLAGVGIDALQGKPIATSIVNNLPISNQAKLALTQGLVAAQQMAKGRNVAQALLDNAVHALPEQYQKAIQVGVALGHAKSLQDAAHSAVHAAAELSQNFKAGQIAAQAIKALPAGVPHPPGLFGVLQRAQAARNTMASVVNAAQQGHPAASQIVQAMRSPLPALFTRVGEPTHFVPIYIGEPLPHHYGHQRRGRGNVQIQPFWTRGASVFAHRAA
jgi:hypothetical protein